MSCEKPARARRRVGARVGADQQHRDGLRQFVKRTTDLLGDDRARRTAGGVEERDDHHVSAIARQRDRPAGGVGQIAQREVGRRGGARRKRGAIEAQGARRLRRCRCGCSGRCRPARGATGGSARERERRGGREGRESMPGHRGPAYSRLKRDLARHRREGLARHPPAVGRRRAKASYGGSRTFSPSAVEFSYLLVSKSSRNTRRAVVLRSFGGSPVLDRRLSRST